jgi:hypothetical protein
VYLLTATAPKPDYELSVKSDAFQLAVGKPLEIPVTIDRSNGFDGEIEIAVAGLPDGVAAAPVKSPAKGDTSKSVQLKIETAEGADVGPFSGAIRITGRVADQPDSERRATARISGLSATTADLWLTVTAADAGG